MVRGDLGQRRLEADRPTFVFAVSDVESQRSILPDKSVSMMEIVQAGPGVFVCSGSDPEGNRFSMDSGNK